MARDMRDAPTDGTEVLVLVRKRAGSPMFVERFEPVWLVGHYDNGNWWVWCTDAYYPEDHSYEVVEPLAWEPMPDIPDEFR